MFEMDPERQPLLKPSNDVGYMYRPLTYEEVKASRLELPWRRLNVMLLLFFWGMIAMFIAMIVCMLITAEPCSGELGPGPSVPAAHLTFAPLISRAKMTNNVYAL